MKNTKFSTENTKFSIKKKAVHRREETMSDFIPGLGAFFGHYCRVVKGNTAPPEAGVVYSRKRLLEPVKIRPVPGTGGGPSGPVL
jgi:hypothetical protein